MNIIDDILNEMSLGSSRPTGIYGNRTDPLPVKPFYSTPDKVKRGDSPSSEMSESAEVKIANKILARCKSLSSDLEKLGMSPHKDSAERHLNVIKGLARKILSGHNTDEQV